MAGGQQQQQGSDNSLAALWISALIVGIVIILWYTNHAFISLVIFKIRLAEIAVVSLFSDSLNVTRSQILAMAPGSATLQFLGHISDKVGSALTIPLGVILVGCVVLLYRMSAKNRFRKIYDIQRFMQQEKKNWPQITPVVTLDLLKTHVHEGVWSMGMTPMQLAKKYKLLKEEKVVDQTGISNREKIIANLIPSRANQIFSRQLGRPWRGIDKLPVHSKALFTIFLAKANGDRDTATRLLRQIAVSAQGGSKLDFSGIDAVLKKNRDSKIMKKVVSGHAYELTVMASMLDAARGDGVLASAEFLWLKPIDRPLWYMLNTVGRRVAFAEVAGPYAHWLAEKLCGRKLIVPMVQEATIAMQAALEEVIYNPEQDY